MDPRPPKMPNSLFDGHPWEIVTEHYQVRTNHSLEEGVRLAARMERLYRVWQQLFVGYWASEPQIARWFKGSLTDATRQSRPVQSRLLSQSRRIHRRAQTASAANRNHHRLLRGGLANRPLLRRQRRGLQQSIPRSHASVVRRDAAVARRVGWETNFWVVEGVACYMESLVEQRISAGWAAPMPSGCATPDCALLDRQFYLPLADLTALGRARCKPTSGFRCSTASRRA